ncbi:hypothetical protein [Streptomyces sp. NPDC001274]
MALPVTPKAATVYQAHGREHLRRREMVSTDLKPILRVGDAEAAVARTALLLENLTREHEANLHRLDRARELLGLTPASHALTTPPVSQPAEDTVEPAVEISKTASAPSPLRFDAPPKYIEKACRVLSRNRLTLLTKTTGILELASGDVRQWVASAAYVDALEELFDGAPVVATMVERADGFVIVQAVRPATRADWDTDRFDFTAYAQFGQHIVTERRQLKKRLAKEHGLLCSVCGYKLLKYANASLAKSTEGSPSLVCRPCKEDWRASQSGTALKAVS